MALLAVGTISHRALARSSESERWVEHTHQVLENLQDLRFAMASVESSWRGFVLTGRESDVETYRASELRVEQDQAAARRLTRDNPEQQRRLTALETLAGRQLERAEMVMSLRRAQGLEAAAEGLRNQAGQAMGDEFQAGLRVMQDEEMQLLAARGADADRRLGQTQGIVLLGTILGLLITAGAGWALRHDAAASDLAEAARRGEENAGYEVEEHLAQMENRYRGLLEAAPDAMVVVNQGGEIVLLNVQAEKQFGYRRDELVGQKVKNIIPQGFAERLIADGTRSAAEALAQQIGTGIELIARHKNGSEFPIEIMLSPLESAEGILVTAAIRDISTRKKAELHLLRKVEELNRSNEELGQFAYIASHDLQEPLRMVASYTQLLSRRYKGKLDADADEFIAFAVDGASRMQRLIQDLLAYSRVGTKGKDLLDTSSEEALQHALINLRGTIEESGAQVTHDPLPEVLADETQLIQLFQNLVGNASNTRAPESPRYTFPPPVRAGKNGSFRCGTTVWESIPSTSKRFSACSSGCTSGKSLPAPASDWPSARRSSNGTAAASRSNPSPATVPPSASPWGEAR